MKVYLVCGGLNYESTEVKGVFDNEEGAKELERKMKSQGGWDYIFIDEHTVNEPEPLH